MSYEIIFISSFIYGISSSFHCITMCGPFVGMLNIIGESKLITNVVYNLGRFTSYTLIGFLMGFLGFSLNLSGEVTRIQNISVILSTVFIVITGIALIMNKKLIPDSGANKIIKKIFFPFIEFMRKSTHTILFSFVFGMFTGLLPCAILYPAFAMALATGNPLLGGISMSSFSLVGIGIIIIGLSTVYFRMNHNHSAHSISSPIINGEVDAEKKVDDVDHHHH